METDEPDVRTIWLDFADGETAISIDLTGWNRAMDAVKRAARDVTKQAEWCEPDGCPAAICNGPHRSHTCPNGDLVTSRVGDTARCPFCGYVPPAPAQQ